MEQKANYFNYDFRDLLLNYTSVNYTSNNDLVKSSWEYFYNPSGEREQKREIAGLDVPASIIKKDLSGSGENLMRAQLGNIYVWAYYLLGAGNEQYAVYYGMEFDDNNPNYDPPVKYVCKDEEMGNIEDMVYFYSAEYNTYGNSSLIALSMIYENDEAWHRHYNICDYLGNVRVVMRENKDIINSYDYDPFGAVCGTDPNQDRTKFINKETDHESSLGDFGVRKYDAEFGRFTTLDPFWENAVTLSPYVYCGNNPISSTDRSGKQMAREGGGSGRTGDQYYDDLYEILYGKNSGISSEYYPVLQGIVNGDGGGSNNNSKNSNSSSNIVISAYAASLLQNFSIIRELQNADKAMKNRNYFLAVGLYIYAYLEINAIAVTLASLGVETMTVESQVSNEFTEGCVADATATAETITYTFKTPELLEQHFAKHGPAIQNLLGLDSYTIDNYLSDANYIIQQNWYSVERNAYVDWLTGNKFGFVGMDRATGNITTFSIKDAKWLFKNTPSLGIYGR